MYRNSTDKRVKHTGQLLFDAIVELLKEKAFSEIGIKEVSTRAGIGRATFYRNFDYVEDVLRLKLDENFAELREFAKSDECVQADHLEPFFQFWVDHPAILEVLIKAKRWDLFVTGFNRSANARLTELVEQEMLSDCETEYLFNIISGMFTGVLNTWIRRGQQENAAQLMALFLLPFELFSGLNSVAHETV